MEWLFSVLMIDVEESYMKRYLIEASVDTVAEKVSAHLEETIRLLSHLPEDKADFAYAKGKWTVRQVVGHILVAHRIFVTRAMCISRGETKSLPGFDEPVYAEGWPPENIGLKELATTYAYEALATLNWVRWMSVEELQRVGEANGIRLQPQHIFRALIGHERHHLKMLCETYGIPFPEHGKPM